ncbi:hypothetical protein ALC53_04783 [Atta colombica]|uniref:Uncharacterized protein n=1 Tax=Atta colombica TaxID=520822 RepID=A0A195BK53_9HYME|nr:hypothetical protein ALC53_04783 [Atta colombica]
MRWPSGPPPHRLPNRPPTIPSERAACNTPRVRSEEGGGLPPTAEYETDATTHRTTHVYMFMRGSGRNEFYTSRENFCQPLPCLSNRPTSQYLQVETLSKTSMQPRILSAHTARWILDETANMVISLWIYLRAYHRRYQYGVRYRYLVVNCDKRIKFRLDMRRRSADNALGYFSIYRARYISQRVLKHSPSVFALARVSRCLFHLATLPESRSRDEFNLSPRHKLHKAPKALCHLGSAYVIIVTISNFCSNRDKETAMLMELKD